MAITIFEDGNCPTTTRHLLCLKTCPTTTPVLTIFEEGAFIERRDGLSVHMEDGAELSRCDVSETKREGSLPGGGAASTFIKDLGVTTADSTYHRPSHTHTHTHTNSTRSYRIK